MKLQDAIDWLEGSFTVVDGAPWRWADLGMSKPYSIISVGNDVTALRSFEDVEHRVVARFITQMTQVKQKAGFGMLDKPRLYVRWKSKVRKEDDFLHCRYYLDGNPGLPGGNPSKPWGRPTVGQIREAA